MSDKYCQRCFQAKSEKHFQNEDGFKTWCDDCNELHVKQQEAACIANREKALNPPKQTSLSQTDKARKMRELDDKLFDLRVQKEMEDEIGL